MFKFFKILLGLSFIVYLFALAVILFLGSRGLMWSDLSLLEYIKNSSNFVPFKTINLYIQALSEETMNIDIPIKNLAGNLLLFLPMGIYLPLLFRKFNQVAMFSIFMIILLFIVEAVQILTRLGSFDIDDFILNMLGALIGFALWNSKSFQKLLMKIQ